MSEARPGLSLRTRLLIGLGVIAAIAAGVAAIVTVTTHSYLVQQLDERLASFAGAVPDVDDLPATSGGLSTSDRPSDAWRAFVTADGSWRVVYAPNTEAADSGDPPHLTTADLPASGDLYLTVDSVEGDDDAYRVYIRTSDKGWDVTALSLEGVESATERLIVIEALGIGATLAGLALVGLWVIRLGIRPMRRMVDASARIAKGDMDVRLEGASAGSESHELAQSLNTMIGRLTASLAERERSEARLREFVADASHELRTPLTTVLGYAQLYRKGALSDASDVSDAWGRTEAEAQRMKRLVEDMLELAKYDALPELHREDADLASIVREIVGDAAAAHPETEFALDGPERARSSVDPDKVRQALLNVVRNAALHGGEHVTVTLTASDELVSVTVADDGPGMSPEVAARATERFVRGDQSRSRATGGSGLGLAITAAIVDAHGGTLAVASAVSAGTTVTLTFPRGSAQSESTDSSRA